MAGAGGTTRLTSRHRSRARTPGSSGNDCLPDSLALLFVLTGPGNHCGHGPRLLLISIISNLRKTGRGNARRDGMGKTVNSNIRATADLRLRLNKHESAIGMKETKRTKKNIYIRDTLISCLRVCTE